MERPKASDEPIKRKVTGEVMYLDLMREFRKKPKAWPSEMGALSMQAFNEQAEMMNANNMRPAIFDEYEAYEPPVDPLGASCAALAEELLTLKRPESGLTCVDIAVEPSPQGVLEKLRRIRAGTLLTGDNAQLAIPSNGDYYPILDIKKRDMTLTHAWLRVFGWSAPKYALTNKPGQPIKFPCDLLTYPSDETTKWYRFELAFLYNHPEHGAVSEKVCMRVGEQGELEMYRDVGAAVYADLGSEGHKERQLTYATNDDFNDFADLIAEVVGDEPREDQLES